MELSVYKIDGQESGKKVVLDDSVFGIEPNDHAMYLDVRQYLADNRQGTHKTKDRSEINRTTKKIGRQKGGGGARHGSPKANIFVGGGRVFGPVPRDYSFKLNKKLKQLARRSALTYKAKDEAIKVVEAFTMDAPKTKEFMAICKNLQLDGQKILLVLPENCNNIYLSARNLPNVNVLTVDELCTYHILNCKAMVMVEDAVNMVNELLGTTKIA